MLEWAERFGYINKTDIMIIVSTVQLPEEATFTELHLLMLFFLLKILKNDKNSKKLYTMSQWRLEFFFRYLKIWNIDFKMHMGTVAEILNSFQHNIGYQATKIWK